MVSIHIVPEQSRSTFAVTLNDDYFGPQPDHDKLFAAISTTPGAVLGEMISEAHSELSSKDQYLLEITANNVAALWRAGFTWDADARQKAFEVVMPQFSPPASAVPLESRHSSISNGIVNLTLHGLGLFGVRLEFHEGATTFMRDDAKRMCAWLDILATDGGDEFSVEESARKLDCDLSQVIGAVSTALGCGHISAWSGGSKLSRDVAVEILRGVRSTEFGSLR